MTEWISVKDSLAPTDCYLLLSIDNKGNRYVVKGSVDSDGRFQDDNGYYFETQIKNHIVTHWAHWPEPYEKK